MAERISSKILIESCANFCVGPDGYRDLPQLIESSVASSSQKQANIQLSFDETYADLRPVRKTSNVEAFVSIMRGCNNMCSFCIVPFTRGRERSRPFKSIVAEIEQLSQEGVREVVLLGQNVNSYHCTSEDSVSMFPLNSYESSLGFTNMYRLRDGAGARFSDLLEAVANINPEMRIRFTSPHPKDFPDRSLHLIKNYNNICSSIHMPVQSGSTQLLARMRRGYTRATYLVWSFTSPSFSSPKHNTHIYN